MATSKKRAAEQPSMAMPKKRSAEQPMMILIFDTIEPTEPQPYQVSLADAPSPVRKAIRRLVREGKTAVQASVTVESLMDAGLIGDEDEEEAFDVFEDWISNVTVQQNFFTPPFSGEIVFALTLVEE